MMNGVMMNGVIRMVMMNDVMNGVMMIDRLIDSRPSH